MARDKWQLQKLLVDPAVPKQIQWLELLGIPGRWGRMDAFAHGRIDISGKDETTEKARLVPAA